MFLTTNNEVIGSLKSHSRHNKPYAHQHPTYYYPLLVLSWVIKQLFHSFLCNSQNYHPLGAVNDPMHCSSGHPQHLKGESFDCCTERNEMVVYCTHFSLKVQDISMTNLSIYLSIYLPMCTATNISVLKWSYKMLLLNC